METLVSIIIPCYNVEAYIADCIDSVLEQSLPVAEIICVDNGSTDRTIEILKKYAAADNRVAVLSEPKRGASNARNLGLTKATGTWVQFLDADDLLVSGKIEHQIALLKASGSADMVVGAYSKHALNGEKRELFPYDDVWKGLFVTRLGITSANLWSKEAVQSVGGWTPSLQSSQESDLMFRMFKAGHANVVFDHQPMTIIRERPSGQISKTNEGENLKRYAALRLEICRYLQVHEPKIWSVHSKFFVKNLLILVERLWRINDFSGAKALLHQVKGLKYPFDVALWLRKVRLSIQV